MKENVYDFSRSKARNAQHVQFVTDLLAAIPQEVAEARGFAAQRTAFAAAAANELECFRPDKAYLETPEIVTADTARDQIFYFYKQVSQAYADYHPDADKRKAGETVALAFREVKGAAAFDYASETATLTDLVEKLRSEPYASALTTVGMESAPDEIEEANEAFNTVYLKRSAEERDRAQSWSMKALRPVTDEAFNALAKAINALYAVNEMVTGDEEAGVALGKVMDDVNAIVVRLKKTMNQGAAGIKPGEGSSQPGEGGEAPDPILPGGGDEEEDEESPDPIV